MYIAFLSFFFCFISGTIHYPHNTSLCCYCCYYYIWLSSYFFPHFPFISLSSVLNCFFGVDVLFCNAEVCDVMMIIVIWLPVRIYSINDLFENNFLNSQKHKSQAPTQTIVHSSTCALSSYNIRVPIAFSTNRKRTVWVHFDFFFSFYMFICTLAVLI